MICAYCDSPNVPWFGQLGSTHWYRCEACHECAIGPDPYWPDSDTEEAP